MRISRYRICNYKAIAEMELNLNYPINPIIGVNESGKTTLLHAILAFDKHRDKVNAGKHLEYANKYSNSEFSDCRITGIIKLDKQEIKELLEYAKVKTATTDYQILSHLTEQDEIHLTRVLSTENKEYELGNFELSTKIKQQVTRFLLERLPYILYFDDFTDRVPDEIAFNPEYENSGKLNNSRIKEWQEIVVEIFKRAGVEGIDDSVDPLRKFFKLSNPDKKDDILSDIEDVLNKEVIQEWKRIKKSGSASFADDSEHLSIELKCNNTTFMFKIKDKSNNDKKRTFNVSDRSKGFQWFFNYMVKLKFNPRYREKKENSIFLLDEPGSYLHSSAQSELLHELSKVARRNTIIYCTHSQYLLNPKVIKLGSIKIVEKKGSSITVTNYGSYKGKDDKGALSAVYQALQLNFTRDFIGKIVITEGVTDMYFFEMLLQNSRIFNERFTVIPGTGAGNSSNLISIGLSFSENFVLLLDNDDAGREAERKYKSEFGDDIQRFICFYSSTAGFELEDLLSKSDKRKLTDLAGTKDIKKALALLYYEYTGHQEQFYKNLDQDTLEKLAPTIKRIREL